MKMDMHDMPMPAGKKTLGAITEFALNWPVTDKKKLMSTHELVMHNGYIYVTGQEMNMVAQFNPADETIKHFPMSPDKAGPHGLLVDKHNQLWVSLEFTGEVVQLDDKGNIGKRIDVKLHASDAKDGLINTAPHGIGLDADGETIWFTGKRTSTLGKISPDGKVTHFQLPQLAALPIFLSAGADKCIWGSELFGSKIFHSTPTGTVTEYTIPTLNSRPVAIIPDPTEPYMWFTEEAGVNIGKIDMQGNITEYKVPARHKNDILASLSFDSDNNLWVQVYVDFANPVPAGIDYIICFDKSIRNVVGTDIHNVPYTMHDLSNSKSMMHRIRPDTKGNLWFTEMMTDTLGKVTLTH